MGIFVLLDMKFGGFRMQTPGRRRHFEMKILFLMSALSQHNAERCVYSINYKFGMDFIRDGKESCLATLSKPGEYDIFRQVEGEKE